MSSVNMAGSRLLAPYTVEVDFTTRSRMPGAFWQAARSCIVPMTLSSFIVPRPPALPGVAMRLMWTTVSTSSLAITLAITGLRMSARTNVTSPMSSRGGTASTPITRATSGSAARLRANLRPRSRETPVTNTTFAEARSTALPSSPRVGGVYLPSLRRWTRVFFSSLRCFFFAIRLRRFLMTEPTNTSSDRHLRDPGPAGSTPTAYRHAGRGAESSCSARDRRSAGGVEALPEVLVHVVFGDSEGPADPHRGQLATVDEAVDRHLGHP